VIEFLFDLSLNISRAIGNLACRTLFKKIADENSILSEAIGVTILISIISLCMSVLIFNI